MPSVDENTLPPSRHARDVPARPQPIKSNKQRGSILLGKNPDLFTVFEDKNQLPAGRKAAEEGNDSAVMGRMNNLEAAVKVLQKKNERTVIDQKTLSDRLSTTEANFVELKYDLLLSSKPSPSTPARSHDSPFDSPNVCPSLTGAEENMTFASPPVPALARKLLRMSIQGRSSSALRTQLRFDSFSDDSRVLDHEAMEIMQDEDCENQYHDTKRDAVSSARKLLNPPPTFDPELSLGDMSLIEGISLDAAQPDAYLDDISTAKDSYTSRLVNEITDVEEENSLDRVDNRASVSSQTEPPIASVPEARGSSDSTSHLVDATMQTDENLGAYCDMAVQVLVPSPTTFDVGMQTSQGDANKLLASAITDQQTEIKMLTKRVDRLETDMAAKHLSSASHDHTALVDAYKALLRVEADRRLDLVDAISTLRADMVSVEGKKSNVQDGPFTWTLVVSHLAVALFAYAAAVYVSGC